MRFTERRAMLRLLKRIRDEETGHVEVGVPALIAAVGAVVLGYGAAASEDVITVIGAWVLGAGIFITGVARHRFIDYDVYRRLEELEK
jgi:hypothetical protein